MAASKIGFVIALAAVAATTATASTVPLHSCAPLRVGIGWHVSATRDVACSTARLVVKSFVTGGLRCRTACTVRGFACTGRFFKDGEHVRCVRGSKAVRGLSFGY